MDLTNIDSYKPNTLRTLSAEPLDYRNPKPEQICLNDIIQGLSNETRFANQTKYPKNVLSHSYAVFKAVCRGTKCRKTRLTALLHDAPEAYMKDIPKPLKDMLPGYQKIEDRIWAVIAKKYGLFVDLPELVKAADRESLISEWKAWDYDMGKVTQEEFKEELLKYL